MKNTQRYWKVKYGYNVADQVSIEEKDIEKAIYAQTKKIPVQLGDKYVNGSNIIVIEPHYHKHTGWFDYYEPRDGDDWAQIKRDCPDYSGWLEYFKTRVQFLIQNGKQELIGKNVEIPELRNPSQLSTGNEISNEAKLLVSKFKM